MATETINVRGGDVLTRADPTEKLDSRCENGRTKMALVSLRERKKERKT